MTVAVDGGVGRGARVPVGFGIGVSVAFGNCVAVDCGLGVVVRVALVAVGIGRTVHAAMKRRMKDER